MNLMQKSFKRYLLENIKNTPNGNNKQLIEHVINSPSSNLLQTIFNPNNKYNLSDYVIEKSLLFYMNTILKIVKEEMNNEEQVPQDEQPQDPNMMQDEQPQDPNMMQQDPMMGMGGMGMDPMGGMGMGGMQKDPNAPSEMKDIMDLDIDQKLDHERDKEENILDIDKEVVNENKLITNNIKFYQENEIPVVGTLIHFMFNKILDKSNSQCNNVHEEYIEKCVNKIKANAIRYILKMLLIYRTKTESPVTAEYLDREIDKYKEAFINMKKNKSKDFELDSSSYSWLNERKLRKSKKCKKINETIGDSVSVDKDHTGTSKFMNHLIA